MRADDKRLDDDRQQLLEGRQAARDLISKDTAEKLEAMRNKAARRFFGEQGIPPHLKAGWAALDQLREMRFKVNYPLPDGGCLLLGRESVVAGAMAEVHTALANMLQLSVDDIRLKLERGDDGSIRPVADVNLPTEWIIPTAKDPRQDPNEAASQYLALCVKRAQDMFSFLVKPRLDACDTRRTDVEQAIDGF